MTSTGSNDTHDDHDDHDSPDTTALDLIEEQAESSIRRVWHDGRWHFSVIDVIALLTDAPKPRQYWFDMKRTIHTEGFIQLSENIRQLKLPSADGKQYRTDAADAETLLRIIQSVPSPKAEPVKQWLARVGAKRLDEVTQPLPTSDLAMVPMPAKPAESAPALVWADYYERMASLYRRVAAYEAKATVVDATLAGHDAQISGIHDRLEALEEDTRLLPEILERLGPQTLTPGHQATVRASVKRLHEVGGYSYATVYAELGDHFPVAKYEQISEQHWEQVAAWFERRIEAAEKRRR